MKRFACSTSSAATWSTTRNYRHCLVPAVWPASSGAAAAAGTAGDLPDLVTGSAVLRAIHDGMILLGLRHELTHGYLKLLRGRRG